MNLLLIGNVTRKHSLEIEAIYDSSLSTKLNVYLSRVHRRKIQVKHCNLAENNTKGTEYKK